jgi:hypothetical protein
MIRAPSLELESRGPGRPQRSWLGPGTALTDGSGHQPANNPRRNRRKWTHSGHADSEPVSMLYCAVWVQGASAARLAAIRVTDLGEPYPVSLHEVGLPEGRPQREEDGACHVDSRRRRSNSALFGFADI